MSATALETQETCISLAEMTDQELVGIVVGAFNKIRPALPYIQELHRRFGSLPRGKANIDGCATWKEFCERRLQRTPEAIRQLLNPPDPNAISSVCPHCDESLPSKTALKKHVKNEHPDEWAKKQRPPQVNPIDDVDIDEQFDEQFDEILEAANRAAAARPPRPLAVVRDFVPKAEDIREFIGLGRREAARKYHPDQGGDSSRMAELNQTADWLKQLAERSLMWK